MHDSLILTIFYVFAALTILSALMVISQNNPVRCVLFLVFTFLCSSVLWILAEAEFLALILVLVYVGAVMTLFLFVVMMLNIDTESIKRHFMRYLPFGLILVALLTGLLILSIPSAPFDKKAGIQSLSKSSQITDTNLADEQTTSKQALSNTEAIGLVLYTNYFLAFELAAVLLLVSIVASITLVHRGAVRSKRQNVVQQIMTDSKDRVKLIDMKFEK